MADEPVAGIYLITVPIPPAPFPGAPPVPDPPIGPGTASVAYHAAEEGETLDDVAGRVVDQGAVGARLFAIDAAHAVEMRLNPALERVTPPAAP